MGYNFRMSEKPMDLNALRERMLKEKHPTPITKDEEISELKANIERLGNTPEEPSMYDVFQNMSAEQKQAEVERLIGQGDRPSTYSIEERAQELKNAVAQTPFGSTRAFRLNILRQQLEALEADNKN